MRYLGQGSLLFVTMSAMAWLGGTVSFGNAIIALLVVFYQLVPALIVVVVLAVVAQMRWRALGYFIGPLTAIVVAAAYCGALYLANSPTSNDPYEPMFQSLFLFPGIPLFALSDSLGMLVAGFAFRSARMRQLLGARPPEVAVPSIGPRSGR